MLKFNKLMIILVLLFTTYLTACNSSEGQVSIEDTENKKLLIYTTIYPLADFTKKIGGEYVEVKSILPAGADAHTFEPTSKTMVEIAEGDAFIFNGLGFEPYADTIAKALKNSETLMVEATHNIDFDKAEHNHGHEDESASNEEERGHEDETESHEEDESHAVGEMDAHVWIDPIRSIGLAKNIKEALIALNPEAKADFEANFEDIKLELEKLDENFYNMVKSKQDPHILVSHAAYGYWENRYGIEQIAVTGLSPSDEPSQKELEKLIEVAKASNINFVIFEQNVTPKIAKIIQKEIGAESLRIHNLAVLTENDIQNGEDYFSLMRKNIDTLNQAME